MNMLEVSWIFCQRKRGTFVTMDYLDEYRVNVIYEMPLSEIIF